METVGVQLNSCRGDTNRFARFAADLKSTAGRPAQIAFAIFARKTRASATSAFSALGTVLFALVELRRRTAFRPDARRDLVLVAGFRAARLAGRFADFLARRTRRRDDLVDFLVGMVAPWSRATAHGSAPRWVFPQLRSAASWDNLRERVFWRQSSGKNCPRELFRRVSCRPLLRATVHARNPAVTAFPLPPNMSLEQHVISAGDYSRTVWYRSGPRDKTHPLCVFLDAEHYLRDMDSLPVIKALLAAGDVPSVSLLFVSHVSSDASRADYACRHVDYTCNDRYSTFIAEDVMRWAKKKNAHTQSQGNMICGLSLSGLASAYLTVRHPEVFSRCLSQSGSFWWLAGKDLRWPPTTARFWLSVGDAETAEGVAHSPDLYQKVSQIAGVEKAAKQLQALGGAVHYHQFAGGHAPKPWRDELPQALKWLVFPTDAGKPAAMVRTRT